MSFARSPGEAAETHVDDVLPERETPFLGRSSGDPTRSAVTRDDAASRRRRNVEPSLMYTRASHSTAANTRAHRARTRSHTGAPSDAHTRARTVNRLHLSPRRVVLRRFARRDTIAIRDDTTRRPRKAGRERDA